MLSTKHSSFIAEFVLSPLYLGLVALKCKCWIHFSYWTDVSIVILSLEFLNVLIVLWDFYGSFKNTESALLHFPDIIACTI